MQKRWLKDFEFHINPATWTVAQDLVQAGRVKNLREVEKHFWVALVETEEGVYETEMIITPHKIKAFTCECFTEGRRLMCPHVAASLFKIRQFLEQRAEERRLKAEAKTPSEISRLTVQNALENVTLDELTEFVREYARRDRNFSLTLKTWFAGSFTEAENPFGLVLDSVIPKSTAGSKTYREADFRRLRTTLDDLEQQSVNALGRQNFRTTYLIGAAILQKVSPLLPKTEDTRREQLLAYLQAALQQLVKLHSGPSSPELQESIWTLLFELGAKGQYPPELLREAVRFLSDSAGKGPRFEAVRTLFDQTPYPAPRFVLYLFLATLAKHQAPAAVVRVLEDYAEQPATLQEAILQLYYLHHWDAVTAAAEHFLPRTIFTAAQRRELEDLLFFIAEKNGDRPRQTRLLRERFVQTGQFDYFNRLKIIALDNWPAELERVLAAFRTANDLKNIAAVLAAEGERQALARLLESNDDLAALQRYEDLFLPEDRNFVRDRYIALLSAYLSNHFGRQASAHVRLQLGGLLQKGETTLVAEIIRALTARFEERHTLPEELAELFPKSKRKAML